MKKLFSFVFSILFSVLAESSSFPVYVDEDEVQTVKLPVVMYHHISNMENLLNAYVITPRELENDLKYLTEQGYKSVTPSELQAGQIPEKPIMITFDDGFLSNLRLAAPILQKYNMRAVVAVIGAVTDEYTENGNTVSDCAYMSWDAVKEIHGSGVFEIACHTYDMHKLNGRKGCAKIPGEDAEKYEETLKDDFAKFNSALFENTGLKTDVIAFPYGEYSSETVSIAAETGYKFIFICDEHINILPADISKLVFPAVLGRYNRPHGKSSADFFGKMGI